MEPKSFFIKAGIGRDSQALPNAETFVYSFFIQNIVFQQTEEIFLYKILPVRTNGEGKNYNWWGFLGMNGEIYAANIKQYRFG